MTVDENVFLARHVFVVVLVPNGHSQGVGPCLDWMPTVTYIDGDKELLLPLAVERPKRRQSRGAVQVVLQVEIVAVAIVGRHAEVKRRSVLGGILVYSSEEGGRLVQPYYLHMETEGEALNSTLQHQICK